MARTLNHLASKFVETTKEPGIHADGGNLYLLVTVSGSKRWVFKYKTKQTTETGKNRQSREMGLGPWPDISLARARELAGDCRKMSKNGQDPIDTRREERKQANGITFGQVAIDLHQTLKGGWRNARHQATWLSSLQSYCEVMWDKPVAELAVSDVLACLQPVWTTRAETATRVRGRIEAVIDAARVRGLIPEDQANPARWKGNLAHVLLRRQKLQRGHHRSMPMPPSPRS